MKVETKKIKTNIEGEKIGINSEKMISLFLNKLYSKPDLALLRESIANAEDINPKGRKNKIEILNANPFTNEPYMYKCRDYGKGIPPDFFYNDFLIIGSSTKDKKANPIGGYGIGRFAGLTVSNMITYTNFYQGKKYTATITESEEGYIFSKEEIEDSDEPSGVLLEVPIKYSTYTNMLEYVDGFIKCNIEVKNKSLPNILYEDDNYIIVDKSVKASHIVKNIPVQQEGGLNYILRKTNNDNYTSIARELLVDAPRVDRHEIYKDYIKTCAKFEDINFRILTLLIDTKVFYKGKISWRNVLPINVDVSLVKKVHNRNIEYETLAQDYVNRHTPVKVKEPRSKPVYGKQLIYKVDKKKIRDFLDGSRIPVVCKEVPDIDIVRYFQDKYIFIGEINAPENCITYEDFLKEKDREINISRFYTNQFAPDRISKEGKITIEELSQLKKDIKKFYSDFYKFTNDYKLLKTLYEVYHSGEDPNNKELWENIQKGLSLFPEIKPRY